MIETDAANFLKKYEGYVGSAMWDVNAYRVGYGSDTLTDVAGNVTKVQKDSTTTRTAALRDLKRRITDEFIPRIQRKIGADSWNRLPTGAQVALISFAYNYGNIVKAAIVKAAQANDLVELAQVWISSTYNDNKALPANVREALRQRRADEVALFSTGTNKKSLIIPLALAAAGIYLLTR
jgi:GH24 family phage-related lysozyme (muramidase)